MKNIAVLISGGGSNLQSLIDAEREGQFEGLAGIKLVVSTNKDAYGLVRAKNANIETAVFSKKDFDSLDERNAALLNALRQHNIDYIVLAGYLGFLSSDIVEEFRDKIINTHPSLLPDFGGKGFFGRAVHEAVLASGVKTSGATVHMVDESYDTGRIIVQGAVEVLAGDTAETLAERVLEMEHKLLPIAVNKLLKGEA